MKKPSILRRLKWSFITMGIGMGAIFPVFASFFVTFRPGMLEWFVLGCVAAGVSVGVVNYWVAHVVLLRRLKSLAQIAAAVRQGDMTVKCTVVSDDSLGEIVDSINGMVDTLNNQIGEMRRSGSSLMSAAETLDQGVRKVMEEQDRVQSQRDRVLAEARRLADGGTNLDEALQQAGSQARSMKDRALYSREQIATSVDSINSALSQVDEANTMIRSLVAAKEEIEQMTTMIGSVADQTNLLALNAAIEAARAGEHGRGFAVVADEVRTLAARSRKATEEIAGVMDRLTRDVSAADQTMGEVTTWSNRAQTALKGAEEELVEVLGAIERSVTATDNVGVESSQHQETIEHLTRDLHGLIDVIASSAEQMHSAETAVSSVRSGAGDLERLVAHFKI